MLSHGRSVLLDVSKVIIEWTVFFLGLKNVCVFHHLLIQSVEAIMWDGIFNDNQPISMQAMHRNLEVLRREACILNFGFRRTDRSWIAGQLA